MSEDIQFATLHINDTTNATSGATTGNQADLTIGILMSILGILVMVANGIALAASRYTTGGRCPEMIFIRTLCVADTMTGLYGVIRPVQLLTCPKWANCFLAEALLFTSFMASNFTLMLMAVDCYVRICHHALFYVNKTTIIFTLVVLWNIAFVIGFVPQMDLNDDPLACSFFLFYNTYYLMFVITVFAACMLPSITLLLYMRVTTHRNAPISCLFYSAKLARDLITTVQLDVALQVVCSVPVAIYMMLNCQGCRLYGSSDDTTHMLVLPVAFLLKSLLAAVLHCVYTKKIKVVLIAFCRHHLPCCVHANVSDGVQENGAAIATISCINDTSMTNASRSIHFKSEFRPGGGTLRQLPQNVDPARNGYYNPVSLERLPFHTCLSSAASVTDQGFTIQPDTSSSTVGSDSSSSLPSTSWVRPPNNRSYMFRPSLSNLSDFYASTELSSVGYSNSSSGENVGTQQASEHTPIGRTFRSLNHSDVCGTERGETDRRRGLLEHNDVDAMYYRGLFKSQEDVMTPCTLEDHGWFSGSLNHGGVVGSNSQTLKENDEVCKDENDDKIEDTRSGSLTEHRVTRLRFSAEQERTSGTQNMTEHCGMGSSLHGLKKSDAMSPTLCERRRKYGLRSQSLLDGVRLTGTRLDSLLEHDETRVMETCLGEHRINNVRSHSLPENSSSSITSPKYHQRGSKSLFHSRRKKPSFPRLASEANNTQFMHLKAFRPCGPYMPTNVDPFCPIHGRMQKRVLPCHSVETGLLERYARDMNTLSRVSKKCSNEVDSSKKEQFAANRHVTMSQFPLRVNLDDYISGFRKMRPPHSDRHLWSNSKQLNSPTDTVCDFSHPVFTSGANCSTDFIKESSPSAVRYKLPTRATTGLAGANHVGAILHNTTQPLLLSHAVDDLTGEQRSVDKVKLSNPVNTTECASSLSLKHLAQSEPEQVLPVLSPTVFIHKQSRLDSLHHVTEDVEMETPGDLPSQVGNNNSSEAGENISCETSDVGYHRAGENISCETSDVGYHRTGENFSCDKSDVDYLQTGENVSSDTSDVDRQAGEIISCDTTNIDHHLVCDTSVRHSSHLHTLGENISEAVTNGYQDAVSLSGVDTSESVIPGCLTNKQWKDKVVSVTVHRTETNPLLQGELTRATGETADVGMILNCKKLGSEENVMIDTRM